MTPAHAPYTKPIFWSSTHTNTHMHVDTKVEEGVYPFPIICLEKNM